MKKQAKITIFSIVIIVLGGVTVRLLTSFLAVNKPVESNTYLLEGWIPFYTLEQVVKLNDSNADAHYLIVGENFESDENKVTEKIHDYFSKLNQGLQKGEDGTWLYANTTLIFNPHDLPQCTPGDSLTILVKAKGSEAGGRFAHFNLIVNGVSIGGRFTSETNMDYRFKLLVPPSGLTSVFVRFDNDLYLKKQDRNLNVVSIRINNTEIPADKLHSLKIRSLGKSLTGFGSEAEQMADYLIQLGIDPSKITTINFDQVKRDQTLAGALSFKQWLENHNLSSFNIVSSGIHCRRSWVTYKKVLDNGLTIGIISFDPADSAENNWYHEPGYFINFADELFSYVSNWIILEMKGY